MPGHVQGTALTRTRPCVSLAHRQIKSTNYLPNVMAVEAGHAAGADYGIFLDAGGFVNEAPTANVAFITRERELVTPRAENVLRGLTLKRVIDLLENDGGAAAETIGIKRCVYADISPAEAEQAVEAMLLGGGVHVTPVVRWNGNPIGDGEAGPVGRALVELIHDDMTSGPLRTPVEYSLYD